jgi:TonB family protein
MRLSLALLVAFAGTAIVQQQPAYPNEFLETGTGDKIHALYAPTPTYPLSVRNQHKGGAGVFVLHMDKDTGLVKSVTIKQTTGVLQLDKSCKETFLRWRFPAHKVPREIIVPIAFSALGKAD